jgi:hypothetical protein
LKLVSPESKHWIEINSESGLIERFGNSESITKTTISIVFEVGGTERRSATGGLEYIATQKLSNINLNGTPKSKSVSGGQIWKAPISIQEISGFLTYKFNATGPALSIGIELVRGKSLIRNITMQIEFELEAGNWILNLPGNGVRGDVELASLVESVGISPLGGLRGSASIVHLSSDDKTLVLWPDNEIEIPEILFTGTSDKSAELVIKSNFGSDLAEIESIEIPFLSLDANSCYWNNFAETFSTWLSVRGIKSPANPPEWVAKSMIFEAQIGYSVFAQVNRYSPYPEVRDLINDLERIKQLGFSCIQLMPRQPYPSYNVHDYADVDISYGNSAELMELIEKAHAKGFKIIFDVLLHGVLDKEIIKIAADGVRNGPFSELLKGDTSDSFSSDVKDWTNYQIAWSRHILDFEPYWLESSPTKTKLESEHPEWFYRDSSGEIVGVYTKAFDARDIGWQEYFTSSMFNLLTKLDIDGFRFDAPTYNDFYNWAPWARFRAGASALACTALFEKMRPIFKTAKEDFLFYTEPSGLKLRESMDLNYNYDEQWLVTSLGTPISQKPWGIRCAKDLARWVKDRDSLLPNGSMTAHHIDSHDTFWWPSWGAKWRREQFDISMVRVLTLIFATLPGPFMMFVGGEKGIEDLLPNIAKLKAEEIWREGEVKWWCDEPTPSSLFGLTHFLGATGLTVLVNAGAETIKFKPEVALGSITSIFTIGEPSKLGDEIVIPGLSGIVFSHGCE